MAEIIEIYTGLTLNYPLQDKRYRNQYYLILKKLLVLDKSNKLPINAIKLNEELTLKNISLVIIEEVLNELHYFGILQKGKTEGEDVDFSFPL